MAVNVNADDHLTPLDALLVIRRLNDPGPGPIAGPRGERDPFLDVNGDRQVTPLDAVIVISALNQRFQLPLVMTEETAFVREASLTIGLGQADGARTYRIAIDADFDTSDELTAIEDVFNVYLVDSQPPRRTLLDFGTPGTPLFSLQGQRADFVPGQTRWDGRVLEIDLTSLSDRSQGSLVFQLLNSDGDTGSQVTLRPVSNDVDPNRGAAPVLAPNTPLVAAGTPLDVASLTPAATVDAVFERVRFDSATGRYAAELRLRNGESAIGRTVAVVLPGLPDDVQVVAPSGTSAAGDAYFNFTPALGAGGLDAFETSAGVLVEIDNPNRRLFPLRPTVLVGAPNRAPVLAALGPLNTTPGAVLVVPLEANDPDGDPVTFFLDDSAATNALPTGTLRGDGRLEFRPTPEQLGSFTFDVVASDGKRTARRTVTLVVAADPDTSTRLSGFVLDSAGAPLAGVPVRWGVTEVATEADGSFRLALAGDVPTGPVEIHGDRVGGATTYPRLAVAPEWLLERAPFTGVDNVLPRPIRLPALDTANTFTIDPALAATITHPALAGAALRVGAGTLVGAGATPFAGSFGLTPIDVDAPPVALPDGQHPDVAVFVGAGLLSFTSPAPLTMPNRASWAEGVSFDLWSLDPITGTFVDVGDGQARAGQVIETTSGGVRTTGLHFFTPRPVTPFDPARSVFRENTDGLEQTAIAPLTSVVELHSGAVREMHALVTYESQGASRGLTLTYDSLRADPRPIVHFGFPAVNPAALAGQDVDRLRLVAQLTIRRGAFEFQVPGFANAPQFGLTGNEHFWSLPATPGEVEAALQADLSTLPSGRYEYELTLGLRRFDDAGQRLVGSATAVTGHLLHVNSRTSPLGSGWGFDGLEQIVENEDGSVLLLNGDGGELRFGPPPAPGAAFVSPPSEFSTLVRLANGTFRRTTNKQTVYDYDAAGRLVSMRDRNTNVTTYAYDAEGRLTSLTDPVGLRTTLTYGAGTVDIVDPADRRTRLELDAAGDLVGITDPDGSRRTFAYDARHHLVSEVNQRGFRETTEYGFHGRALGGVRADGSVLRVDPIATRGLSPPERSRVPFTAPASDLVETALDADANGNVTSTQLDQSGQTAMRSDRQGLWFEVVARNAANLPTRVRVSDNFYTITYDAFGNAETMYDEVSNLAPAPPEFPLGLTPGTTLHQFQATDFDGDGRADLGYVESGNGVLETRYFPSLGDGTFGPSRFYMRLKLSLFGDVNDSLVPLDFDGDGLPDRDTDDDGFVDDRDGDGISDETSVLRRLEADVNDDGSPDVVYFVRRKEPSSEDLDNDGEPDPVFRTYVVSFRGQGGTFERDASRLFPDSPVIDVGFETFRFTNERVLDARLGDTDGDGDQDLIVLASYEDNESFEETVGLLVLANAGDGTFATVPHDRLLRSPDLEPILSDDVFSNLRAVDMNGDGRVDLVRPRGVSSGNTSDLQLTTLLGEDDSFVAGPTFEIANVLGIEALRDLNGDGRADLLTRRSGQLAAVLNEGANFGRVALVPFFSGTLVANRPAFGDVNNDSQLDLFWPGILGGFPPAVRATIALGDIPPTLPRNYEFLVAVPFELGEPPFLVHQAVALGDVDGDDDLDFIALKDDGRVAVRLNDGTGRPETLGAPIPRRMDYDDEFNEPLREVDELGQVTSFVLDPNTGNRLSETTIVGQPGGDDDVVKQFTYTADGLVDTVIDACACAGTQDNDYDAFGRLVRRTLAAGTPDEAVWQYEYDAAGNQTAIIDPNGHRTEHEYDARNRLVRVVRPDPDDAGPLASPVTTLVYDAAGNPVSSTDPLGRVTVEEFDALNRIVRRVDPDPDGAGPLPSPVTRWTYDPAGNKASEIDPLGHETRYHYDARDRMVEMVDPEGGVTRYEYDAANHRTAVVDPAGNRTTFAYDGRRRLIRETDPLGQSIVFEYDAADRRTARVDREGRRITFAYDELDRLTTETWVVPGVAPANVVRSTYDQRGNLLSLRDDFSSLTYTYDALNRVRTADNAGTPGVPHVVLAYAYDAVGNVLSVAETIAGQPGATTAFTYDGLDRVVRITQSGAGSPKRVDFTYDVLGQFESIGRFRDLAGTELVVASDYDFDGLNRLVSLVHANGTANVAFYELAYDAAGRIVRIEDIDGTRAFAYDDTSQLTGVDGATFDESFSYDRNGNRTGAGRVTGPGNRLLSDGTFGYEYDDDGSLLRRTETATGRVREFTWDHRHRLVAVIDRDSAGGPATQTVRFTYDAQNRRLTKSVDTAPADAVDAAITHFVYDREDVLLDFVDTDGSGPAAPELAVRYLHGPGFDTVLAQEDFRQADPAARVLWLLPDHLGSTRDLVDSAGVVRNHIVYDAFGGVRSQTNPAFATRYLFTGREFDPETGLYYYRARYYDPATGRFLSEDPLRFEAGDVNLQRYVGNDPLRFVDPSGASEEGVRVGFSSDRKRNRLTIYTHKFGVSPSAPWFLFSLFFGDWDECAYHYEYYDSTYGGRINAAFEKVEAALREDLEARVSDFGFHEAIYASTSCVSSVELLFVLSLGILVGARLADRHRRRPLDGDGTDAEPHSGSESA